MSPGPAIVAGVRRGESGFIHSTDSEEGCGRGSFFRSCIIRDSVTKAFRGQEIVGRRAKMELVTDCGVREIFALITVSGFTHDGERLALLIIEDISQLVELQKIVPICANCKKVRDDDEFWTGVESFSRRPGMSSSRMVSVPSARRRRWPNSQCSLRRNRRHLHNAARSPRLLALDPAPRELGSPAVSARTVCAAVGMRWASKALAGPGSHRRSH